jgi:Transposase DDE domain
LDIIVMFVRTKRSDRKDASYEYLQIVRSYREGGKVRQQVVASLGRKEALLASGELDGLLRSLAKYSEKLRVVEAVRTSGLAARSAKQWGPALVFGRLWEKQGLPDLLLRLAQDRKFAFSVERAVFAMVLQRLCVPGSDLAGSEWVKTVESPGFEDLALQHFYRTTAFLAGVREELESKLFHRDLTLFNQTLDVVFIDTTSLYCYRDSETDWRRRGYSRDHRPDLPQFVVCVAVNAQGWPIAWEIFPGNTADHQALRQVVTVLRQRFTIRQVTVVADRGMISRETLTLLTEDDQAPFDYVLGCGCVGRRR